MMLPSNALRFLVVVAAGLLGSLSLWGAAIAADDLLDLPALIVDNTEISTDEIRYRLSSEHPFDLTAELREDDPQNRYVRDNTRQGWDRHFVAETAELRVRIVEFTSNRWARMLHTAGEPAPGYPGDAQVLVRDEDGKRTLAATVVEGRTQIVVLLTTPLTTDPEAQHSTDLELRRVLTTQLTKLPHTADLPEKDSVLEDWRISAVTAVLGTPLLALILFVYLGIRDLGFTERISTGTVYAEPVPSVPVRNLAEAATRARRRARLRCAVLAAAVAGLGTLAVYLQLSLSRSIVLLYLTVPAVTLVVLLVDTVLHGYRTRRAPGGGAIGVAMAGLGGAIVVATVTAIALSTALWTIAVGRVSFLFATLALLIIVTLLAQRIERPLYWAKKPALRRAALRMDADDRRPVLLFRSSLDAERVIRTRRCAIAGPGEAAATLPFERFESVLAWALWRLGPVWTTVDPDSEPPSAEIGREMPHRAWWAALTSKNPAPALTVLVIGRSEGCVEAVRTVANRGALSRCLFVLPPVAEDEVWDRLVLLADATGVEPESLRAAAAHVRAVVGVYYQQDGTPVLVAADRRDDIVYRTMIEQFGCEIGARVEVPLNKSAPPSNPRPYADLRRWLATGDRPRAVGPMDVRGALRYAFTQLRWLGRNRDDDFDALIRTRARIRELVRNKEYGAIYDRHLTAASKEVISKSYWIERSKAAHADAPPPAVEASGAVVIRGNDALMTTLSGPGRRLVQTATYRRTRAGQWRIDLVQSG